MNVLNRTLLAAAAVFAAVIAASAAQATPSSAALPSPVPQQAVPAGPPGSPAASPAQGPAAGSAAASDKNAAVYTRTCSLCHDAQRILSNRRTRDQWSEVIDKMVERGAQGSDEDFNAVLEYLVSHYGRINVNRGSAKDLETVLKLSDKDAEAIVAYRKDHGPIADFDALSQVPGIDVPKLSQNRDGISF